jgi:mono/diheme cytochrome c family protein
VGAIVSSVSAPPATGDRIDFQGLGHAALSGSARQAADPDNPLKLAQPAKVADWLDIEKYMQSIRSPRAPTNLDQAQVDAGRALFSDQANCQGCHGGEKWTVSRRFYSPSSATMTALNSAPLTLSGDFPSALLPAHTTANQTLRFAGGNAAANDQILCVLRPVGTWNVAEDGVGVAEVRADMTTPSQGDGNPAGEGRGYNVPSLLGIASGAPYLHAGNARTLEALFGTSFTQHHQALAANFLTETDAAARAQQVSALVQYLLSIDEQTAYPGLPGTGASGGSLCPQSF